MFFVIILCFFLNLFFRGFNAITMKFVCNWLIFFTIVYTTVFVRCDYVMYLKTKNNKFEPGKLK